jgi:hypothetical protein
MNTKANKPKSPPTPSRALGDCVADVKKLYAEYSHGNFAKPEIASNLGFSANSGPFAARLFTLKQYGLLTQSGTDYSVTETFMTLNSTGTSDARFKTAAVDAIRKSDVFRELLDEFKNKLPSTEAVANRLETLKRFNAERAKLAANVLEKSLRYAGVLDGSNNILPIREALGASGRGAGSEQEQERADQPDPGSVDENVPPDTLGIEIPVGDGRKVVIRYPQDLSADEAKKVGNVLNAIVS